MNVSENTFLAGHQATQTLRKSPHFYPVDSIQLTQVLKFRLLPPFHHLTSSPSGFSSCLSPWSISGAKLHLVRAEPVGQSWCSRLGFCWGVQGSCTGYRNEHSRHLGIWELRHPVGGRTWSSYSRRLPPFLSFPEERSLFPYFYCP